MPLNTVQKNAVNSFVSITNSDKKSAEKLLRQNGWDVQVAVDAYFADLGPRRGSGNPHASALNKLFDKYRDYPTDNPDQITLEGTQKYLADLSIPLDDIRMLILSTILQCPSLGTIDRQGFVDGWSPIGATTVAAQKNSIAHLASTSQTSPAPMIGSNDKGESVFKRTYKYTFTLALPSGGQARAVPLEEASEYWRVLLGANTDGMKWVGQTGSPWIEWWINFLGERWKKSVNKDLWNQTLIFAEKVLADETLAFWSEDAAWPGVIDEFVAWVKEKRESGESMDVS